MLVKSQYNLETDEHSYCQGIVADGQYQSAGFRDELMKLLPFDFNADPVLATFFGILWDPGHFLIWPLPMFEREKLETRKDHQEVKCFWSRLPLRKTFVRVANDC
jgi:hypothetical protein